MGFFDLYFHIKGVLHEDKVLEEAGGNLDSRPGCDTTLTNVWPRESRTFGSQLCCSLTVRRQQSGAEVKSGGHASPTAPV